MTGTDLDFMATGVAELLAPLGKSSHSVASAG